MDKNFLKVIFNRKTQDYSLVIIFLLVSSFFIIFAINPSLKTIFSLKKEEKDLTQIDSFYEQKISNVVDIQSRIEEIRDDLYLLDKAIANYPEVNSFFDDVKKAMDKNSFFITKANISNINLKEKTKTLGKIELQIEGKSSFENLMNLVDDLFAQKRLKLINNLVLNRDIDSTNSSQLNVFMVIEGYFL